MITPFRMIKNEYMRKNKNQEEFWNILFTNFLFSLEDYFLNNYNILHNDIIADRNMEIERFSRDFMQIDNIDEFLVEQNLINKQDSFYRFFNSNIDMYNYSKATQLFDEIKLNLTEKKIKLCFNLTPIREPN